MAGALVLGAAFLAGLAVFAIGFSDFAAFVEGFVVFAAGFAALAEVLGFVSFSIVVSSITAIGAFF